MKKILGEKTDFFGIPKFVSEGSGKRHFKFMGDDEVGKFWMLTVPNKNSTLDDCLIELDLFDFILQLRGGLDPEDIVGFYKEKEKPTEIFKDLKSGGPGGD